MGSFTKHLIYFSYGSGPHIQEISFSILSALKFLLFDRAGCEITLYTDHPEFFEDLPIRFELLDRAQLKEWAGPNRHEHRRKSAALRHALATYSVPTVALDGDTYFLKHPAHLFAPLKPGHSVMHLLEGHVGDLSMWRAFSGLSVTDPKGREWVFPPDSPMWNGGVEGLHPDDACVMDDVLMLMDAMYSKERWISEQFATGVAFSRSTVIHETGNVVFHYWHDEYRSAFRKTLQSVIPQYASLPISERIRACYAHRPQPTLRRAVKKRVIAFLQSLGYSRRGWVPRTSG